jgi:hypothetical protein
MPTAEPPTLEDAARRAGAWAWAEAGLYGALGGWARNAKSAAVKLYFDACSQHHAWRCGLWRERLAGRLVQAQPGSLPQPPPGVLAAPSRTAEEALKALASLEGDVGRLGAYCRVALPRVAAAYRHWHRACNPSSDAPLERTLKIALADLKADLEEGCDLLVALLDEQGARAVAAAAECSKSVEGFWVGWGFW